MKRQKLIQKLLQYFENIPNPTDNEKELMECLKSECGYFEVTSVCRDDVAKLGYDGSALSDSQMEYIAHDMEDLFDNSFLDYLSLVLEDMGIPKKNS